MQGLAQAMAQPQGADVVTIEQVIQMLMQNVDPDQIVEMGVDPRMVVEAINIVEQKLTAQEEPVQGLAATSVQNM